jgi:hypothetical protein
MAGPIGSTIGVLTGFAVGEAAAAALEPAFEIPRQDAWSRNANRILDVDLLARLVAQGGIDLSDAAAEAKRDGYTSDKLDALIYLAQTVPGIGEATALWRRGLITDALFSHVLVKEGLDQRYVTGIIGNKLAEPLGLGDIAYAVVRGILPTPSYVPVAPPTSGDKVPRFPQVNVDPNALAALLGYDPQALEIMVGRSGLSMAPVMAAQALFRGIIGPNDFLMAIAEGDLRTEWADAVRDASREIPTLGQMMEHALRGFESVSSATTNAQRHGTSGTDAQLVYDNLGRAPNIHAVTTALARGGNYDGTPQTIPEPFLSAVQRADIRPEWYGLEYANRYTYPSAFVLRALAQAGDLGGESDVEQLLLEVGWKPDLATKVATAWTSGSTTGDPHVTKAQSSLWTTMHKSYIAQESDAAALGSSFTALGITAAAQTQIIDLWNLERGLIHKELTATQIKKAYTSAAINPATGAAWTKDDALTRLIEMGYSANDANTFLDL